jgi:hypothetical protein
VKPRFCVLCFVFIAPLLLEPYFSTLKMKAICSSDTSPDFYRTTRRYITEDRTLKCFKRLKKQSRHMCFEIFKAVIFLVVSSGLRPCSLVSGYWRFGRTCCLHFQGWSVLNPEDGSIWTSASAYKTARCHNPEEKYLALTWSKRNIMPNLIWTLFVLKFNRF